MDEVLIEKVRQYKVLYNIRSSHYRDYNIRQKAWEEIAKELQTTAVSVKNSWEKLRRCFLNALSRRRMKKSVDAAKKTNYWKYEEQMAFLLPYIEVRRTKSNISSNVNSPEEVETAWETNIAQFKQEFQAVQEADRNITEDITENAYLLNIASETPSRIQTSKKRKRAASNDGLKPMAVALKGNDLRKKRYQEIEKRTNVLDSVPTMDETDMFFMSMSKTTKTLPLVEQAKLKKMLSNAVLDAQIKMSQNQHRQPQNDSVNHSPNHSEASTPSTIHSGYSSAE